MAGDSTTPRPSEAERCRREIAEAERLLSEGHMDVAGLCLALADWSEELRIVEEKMRRMQKLDLWSVASDASMGPHVLRRVARCLRDRLHPVMSAPRDEDYMLDYGTAYDLVVGLYNEIHPPAAYRESLLS